MRRYRVAEIPPRAAGGHHHGWRGGKHGLLRGLPRERRGEIKALLKDHWENNRPLRTEARDARRAVADLLEEDPLDRKKLEQALDVVQEKSLAARRALRPLIFELADKLEPHERSRVIRRFIGGRHGRRGRHRRDRY